MKGKAARWPIRDCKNLTLLTPSSGMDRFLVAFIKPLFGLISSVLAAKRRGRRTRRQAVSGFGGFQVRAQVIR
jgi:hypothetical protein